MRRLSLIAGIFAALFFQTLAWAAPSPSNLLTSHVTCANTATLMVAAQPGMFHVVTIEQTSSTAFYIGGSAVTTSNGFAIPGVPNSSYTISYSGALYCITASSTATVTVIETTQGGAS